MNQIRRERTEPGCTVVLEALSHQRRRRTLQYLRRVDAASVEEIAGVLGSGAGEASWADAETDPEAIQATLEHRHLPKLARAELVARNGERVAAGDHPVLEDSRLDDILSIEADDWDDVLDCLAAPRRRTVLSVLAARDEAIDRTALAREVAQREPETDTDDVERLLTELYHVHLPKLAGAGLVAFEDGHQSVRYLGHPELGDLARSREEDARIRKEITQ